MTDSLEEAKFKTVNHILVDVKAKALVHTVADWLTRQHRGKPRQLATL